CVRLTVVVLAAEIFFFQPMLIPFLFSRSIFKILAQFHELSGCELYWRQIYRLLPSERREVIEMYYFLNRELFCIFFLISLQMYCFPFMTSRIASIISSLVESLVI